MLIAGEPAEVTAPKPPGLLAYIAVGKSIMKLESEIAKEMKRGNHAAAEALCRKMIEQAPHVPNGYYNLACTLALLGKKDDAFSFLDQAIAHGMIDVDHIKSDGDLTVLRDDARFSALLERAAKAPPAIPLRPAVPLAVDAATQTASIREENIAFDPKSGQLRTAFRFEPAPPADRLITKLKGEAAELLLKWYAEGSAAGNWGDLYDNRDGDHSDLSRELFPTLTWLEHSPEAKDANLHWGLQNRIIHPGIVIGNASVAQTDGPYWRSMPRMACANAAAATLLYRQYRENKLYFYPCHVDHTPGRNGKLGDAKGGHGDVYSANTPYMIISQGSSGTDQVFIQAVAATLAAFQPQTKKKLAAEGLLMPAVQMIFRISNKPVAKPEDYLSGVAHPPVFAGSNIEIAKMVKLAHEITPDNLPPLAQIKILEEDQAVPGRDYFEPMTTEKLFDTPCSIARVMRGSAFRRRMLVSAEESFDANKKPLKFRWVVLRGDAEKIRIKPLNENQSRAELSISYHARRPIAPGAALESNRVEIGVFVHNGTYFSSPAYITFFTLDNEERVYDDAERIQKVTYSGAGEPGNYVDPVVSLPKSWRDEYHYDADKKLTGWSRHRGEKVEEFTAEGRLILKPGETRAVRYAAQPKAPNQAPVIVQQTVEP